MPTNILSGSTGCGRGRREASQEFFNHVRKYQATHAGNHDPREIFEAWAIQKIAALQYTVLQLGEKINELAVQIQRR